MCCSSQVVAFDSFGQILPLESAYWVISFIFLHYASVSIIQQPQPFLTTLPPSCIYFFKGKVFSTFNYLEFIMSFQTYHLLKIWLLLFALIVWLQICKDPAWFVLILSFSKNLWFYCTILPSMGFFWNTNLIQGPYFRAVLSTGACVFVRCKHTVHCWHLLREWREGRQYNPGSNKI